MTFQSTAGEKGFRSCRLVFPVALCRGLLPDSYSTTAAGTSRSGSSPTASGGAIGNKLVCFQTEVWVHKTWVSNCPQRCFPIAPHNEVHSARLCGCRLTKVCKCMCNLSSTWWRLMTLVASFLFWHVYIHISATSVKRKVEKKNHHAAHLSILRVCLESIK